MASPNRQLVDGFARRIHRIIRGFSKLSNYRNAIIYNIDKAAAGAYDAQAWERITSPKGVGRMDVRFASKDLDRLETDLSFNAGHSDAVVTAFRKRMQLIRGARDERDFYALRSLVYKKLQGNRAHQKSMRLNDQWRLIIELQRDGTEAFVLVVGIEDYH